MKDLVWVDVDRKLTANLFNLVMDIFVLFISPKYKKSGFVSRFAICKIISGTDNPNGQVRLVVDYCVEWNLLVYAPDGLLYFDYDGFEKFFMNTARGKKMFKVVDALSTIRV